MPLEIAQSSVGRYSRSASRRQPSPAYHGKPKDTGESVQVLLGHAVSLVPVDYLLVGSSVVGCGASLHDRDLDRG